MRFAGTIERAGRYWAVEVPMLGVHTQGRTRREAFEMIEDALVSLVDREGFEVAIHPGAGGYFEVRASDFAPLIALMLKRQRLASGLTLAQVASRLGVSSHNAYARYEQGRCQPTLQKLDALIEAVSDGGDLVLEQSRA